MILSFRKYGCGRSIISPMHRHIGKILSRESQNITRPCHEIDMKLANFRMLKLKFILIWSTWPGSSLRSEMLNSQQLEQHWTHSTQGTHSSQMGYQALSIEALYDLMKFSISSARGGACFLSRIYTVFANWGVGRQRLIDETYGCESFTLNSTSGRSALAMSVWMSSPQADMVAGACSGVRLIPKRRFAQNHFEHTEKEVRPKRRFGTPKIVVFLYHKSISLEWHILTSSPLSEKQHTSL